MCFRAHFFLYKNALVCYHAIMTKQTGFARARQEEDLNYEKESMDADNGSGCCFSPERLLFRQQ